MDVGSFRPRNQEDFGRQENPTKQGEYFLGHLGLKLPRHVTDCSIGNYLRAPPQTKRMDNFGRKKSAMEGWSAKEEFHIHLSYQAVPNM